VRRLAAGGSALDPQLVQRMVGRRRALDDLTPRQREVMALMAEGRSSGGIADERTATVAAGERHVTSVFDKLGLRQAGAGSAGGDRLRLRAAGDGGVARRPGDVAAAEEQEHHQRADGKQSGRDREGELVAVHERRRLLGSGWRRRQRGQRRAGAVRGQGRQHGEAERAADLL
jgi:DNA-binding CsgD family transcriptional regulator